MHGVTIKFTSAQQARPYNNDTKLKLLKLRRLIHHCMKNCIGWCELNLVNQNARWNNKISNTLVWMRYTTRGFCQCTTTIMLTTAIYLYCCLCFERSSSHPSYLSSIDPT